MATRKKTPVPTLPCTRCKEDKPVDEFGNARKYEKRSGKSIWCKACTKAYMADHKAKKAAAAEAAAAPKPKTRTRKESK